MINSHNFKKQYGQNFLKNLRYAEKVAEALQVKENETILEIGPGDGTLTKALLAKGKKVISIEVDYDLLANLLRRFAENQNFSLEHADFMEADLTEVLKKYNSDKNIVVTGSLPYNISKMIINRLIEYQFGNNPYNVVRMVFIIQEEVAKEYSSQAPRGTFLGNYLSLFAEVKKLESIPAKQFYPTPKVNGAILLIDFRADLAKNYKEILKLIKIGFVSPRKTLYGNLKNSNKYDLEKIKTAMIKMELKETVRAHEINLEQWIQLNNLIST